MRPLRLLAAVFLTASSCSHALATDLATVAVPPSPPAALRWQCHQHFDAHFTVECDADSSRTTRSPQPGDILQAAEAAEFDPRPVALRGHAMATREPWRVPLLALPFSAAEVEYLLQAVLCGRHPDCAIDYANPGLPRVTAIAPYRRRR